MPSGGHREPFSANAATTAVQPQWLEPRDGDWRPVPDPTFLTTASIDREVSSFREVVKTRLRAIDEATKLVAADVARISESEGERQDRVRSEFDQRLAAQREYLLECIRRVTDVATERFAAFATQLAERDERVKQAAADSKTSLDAALAAQKEAAAEQNRANQQSIAKSELGQKEGMAAQGTRIEAVERAMGLQIGDLKDRLARLEQSALTRTEVKTDFRGIVGIAIFGAALIISAITLVIGLQ